MKNTKKYFILLMASVFIFAMSVTAFGATPADGSYKIAVTLSGGSGKASVQSAELTVSGGQMTAKIIMSSSSYTYMVVNGTTYNNEAATGSNSTFTIPVAALDTALPISACTIAMSEPHVIDYTLTFNSSSLPASNTSQQPTTAAANSGGSSNGGANSSATTSNNGGISNSGTTISQEETTTIEETVTAESATDETESFESTAVKNNKESKNHTIAIVITIIVIIIAAALAVLIYKKRDQIFKRRDQ